MPEVLSAPQRRPSFSERLGVGVGRGIEGAEQMIQQHQLTKNHPELAGLPPEFQKMGYESKLRQGEFAKKFAQEQEFEGKDYDVISGTFGKKFADIWKAAPVGGRTKLLQHAIDAHQRGVNLENVLEDMTEKVNENETPLDSSIEIIEENQPQENSKKTNFDKEISDYLKKQDEGLVPSEKVARGKERFDTGLKQYQEAGTKLRSMTRDKERIGILEQLNKSKKLPSDLGRANVDQEGNLRAPFAASPESERYVKTLNEFSQGAKDTFGSRVTNFDLSQYLKRFPTLLNSEEGRRQLLDQMKIVNQINSVYYKNLKNVYDKAGGVRNIDADVAERFAEKLSENQVQELGEKFKQIGQFSSKPSASEFKGKKIRDKETGEIFISDGSDWIPGE